MVKHDDLGNEHFGILAWVILLVGADITSLDVLDGQVLDVETNVITWGGLLNLLVVHLDGLNFSGDTNWTEGDDHTCLDDTGLDTTNWHSSNTTNLVDVLEWETEWLFIWALGEWDIIKGLKEDWSFVPWHVLRSGNHVVTVPAGNWDKVHLEWLVADLLEVTLQLPDNFIISLLGVVDGAVVHLVDSDDHLTHTHGLGKKSVFTGLTIS
jgi:hypothetical protein